MFYAVTTGRKHYAVNNEHAAKGLQSQENAGEDLSHCVLVELRCLLSELHCVLSELRFEQRLEGAVVTGFHAHLRTHPKK